MDERGNSAASSKVEGGEGRARVRAGGPGWLVAAAFIGPGTVTTATVAGASFGTALLWALLFATLAAMILQEMSARLGLVTGKGLGEAIRSRFENRGTRIAAVALVIGAIAIGNAAYQTGNLLGGSLGLAGLWGGHQSLWVLLIGGAAFLLLWTGSYRLLERVMVLLVALMSVTFLGTMVTVLPPLPELLSSLVVPSLPPGSLLTVIGLVGTTVVPYNLFLHASAVGEKWDGVKNLPQARMNLVLSIGLGGAVSMAILLTSAGTIFGTGEDVRNAAGMAAQLEPLLGGWARTFFALGLFAAGMTSAITAPLAAAYATAGAIGWERDLSSPRLRAVWGAVLGVGIVFALTVGSPVPAILFAQAANGILLPAVAVFLLLVMNDERRMGRWRNRLATNLLGGVTLLVALLLGGRGILKALGIL